MRRSFVACQDFSNSTPDALAIDIDPALLASITEVRATMVAVRADRPALWRSRADSCGMDSPASKPSDNSCPRRRPEVVADLLVGVAGLDQVRLGGHRPQAGHAEHDARRHVIEHLGPQRAG